MLLRSHAKKNRHVKEIEMNLYTESHMFGSVLGACNVTLVPYTQPNMDNTNSFSSKVV